MSRAERRSSRREIPRAASLAAALLPLLGGCARLAGIEETSGDGLVGVSFAVERVSVGNTIVRGPQDLGANTATYLIADELDPSGFARVAATETELGVWTAEIFDETPPVLFDLPESGPAFQRLWTIPTPDLLGSLEVLEHPDPTPLPDPMTAMLTVNATLDRPFAAETFELFVVGTWNSRGLDPPAMAGLTTLTPPPFPASSMGQITGRPHEQITVDDAVLILRRTGAALDGVLEVTPFDQTGADTLTGTIATVAPDQMLDIRVAPVDAMTRLSAARPGVGNLTFSWQLRAAPGRDLGLDNGPLLHSATVLLADTMAQAAYANPFAARGWGTALTYVVNATRTITPAGSLPVTLSATMVQVVADPTPALELDFPAGRVEAIAMDGISLSTDDMTVPAPTGPVVVTMTTDRTSDTFYMLDLMELVPNAAGTALESKRVLNAISLEKSFTLPHDVFEAGKLYTLRATSFQGLLLDIASGDLRTRTLPLATAALDSGVFQVVP